MKAKQERPAPEFKAGDRVQFHPASDIWMRGARFGTVKKVVWHRVNDRWMFRVEVDATGREGWFSTRSLDVRAGVVA